jgi:cell wall assembly regulator SMI1
MTTDHDQRAEICSKKLLKLGVELGSGLSLSELKSLEQSIGQILPRECEAVLRAFGGASIVDNAHHFAAVVVEESTIGELLFLEMLPTSEWLKNTQLCKEEWSFLEADLANDPPQTSGPARAVLIGKDRILFGMGHGVSWFLDFAPLEGGNPGQVIVVYAMPQEHHVFVIAPDLLSFFELVAASLE